MCKEFNISIPEELSVICYDNIETAKHLQVLLTIVAQFPRIIG